MLVEQLMERRANLENPSNALATEWDFLAESAGHAGVAVDEKKSLSSTAIFRAVRLLAETEASIPLHVYEQQERGKRLARTHPVYPVVHTAPNPEMSAMNFRESLMAHLVVWGDAYAEIVRDRGGRVRQLWPLLPDRTHRARDASGNPVIRTVVDGKRIEMPFERVLHIPGIGFDGRSGWGIIDLATEAVGLTLATEKFGAKFFGSGSHLGGVIEHPERMSDKSEKHLRRSWERMHSGLENAHRVAILEEGSSFNQIGVPPEAAQFLETRKFQVNEIARLTGVQPHLLMDLERATYCLPGDAMVYTVDGPVPIKEVEAGDRVWSFDEEAGWVRSRVNRSENTGRDEILTIQTTNRTIRLNSRHRVLARRPIYEPAPAAANIGGTYIDGQLHRKRWVTKYVQAGELEEGDTVVALRGLPEHGGHHSPTRELDTAFMEFCGLLLGDGNVDTTPDGDPKSVTVARADSASYMDHYRDIMREQFRCARNGNGRGGEPASDEIRLVEGDRYTRFSSASAARELIELGLSGTAHTKKVPGWVFRADEARRLAFLRGFLDADGHVDKKGRISFSSCNRRLLSGIRHLCMGLGVPVTNLHHREGVTTLPSGDEAQYSQYYFTCSDPGANQRIGSNDPRYQARLVEGQPFDAKDRNYPRYGGKGFEAPGCSLGRIVKIECDGVEDVYDLSVAETHSFVADGIVVHNSNVEQQSLEFVKYSLRPWLVRIEQALNQQVIGARKDFFAEHVVEGLLRGDSEQRAEFFKTMFQNGVFTINDILEKENMNPAPPEIGERRMVRRDMIPVDRIDDLVDRLPADSRREQAGADETATRGAARAFEDAFGRMVRAECQEHRGELPRIFAEEGVEGWREYLEDFYGDEGRMAGIVERTVGPTARAWTEAFAEDRLSDLEVRTLVASDDGYVSDLSDRYRQASRDIFVELCEEEEPRCATEEQLSAWMDDERPDHIQQLATREARRLRGRVMEAYEAKRLRPERGST